MASSIMKKGDPLSNQVLDIIDKYLSSENFSKVYRMPNLKQYLEKNRFLSQDLDMGLEKKWILPEGISEMDLQKFSLMLISGLFNVHSNPQELQRLFVKLINEIIDLNPEFQEQEIYEYRQAPDVLFDFLFGVASRYNKNDIEYYAHIKSGMKGIDFLNRQTRRRERVEFQLHKVGKTLTDGQYTPSPESLDIIEAKLGKIAKKTASSKIISETDDERFERMAMESLKRLDAQGELVSYSDQESLQLNQRKDDIVLESIKDLKEVVDIFDANQEAGEDTYLYHKNYKFCRIVKIDKERNRITLKQINEDNYFDDFLHSDDIFATPDWSLMDLDGQYLRENSFTVVVKDKFLSEAIVVEEGFFFERSFDSENFDDQEEDSFESFEKYFDHIGLDFDSRDNDTSRFDFLKGLKKEINKLIKSGFKIDFELIQTFFLNNQYNEERLLHFFRSLNAINENKNISFNEFVKISDSLFINFMNEDGRTDHKIFFLHQLFKFMKEIFDVEGKVVDFEIIKIYWSFVHLRNFESSFDPIQTMSLYLSEFLDVAYGKKADDIRKKITTALVSFEEKKVLRVLDDEKLSDDDKGRLVNHLSDNYGMSESIAKQTVNKLFKLENEEIFSAIEYSLLVFEDKELLGLILEKVNAPEDLFIFYGAEQMVDGQKIERRRSQLELLDSKGMMKLFKSLIKNLSGRSGIVAAGKVLNEFSKNNLTAEDLDFFMMLAKRYSNSSGAIIEEIISSNDKNEIDYKGKNSKREIIEFIDAIGFFSSGAFDQYRRSENKDKFISNMQESRKNIVDDNISFRDLTKKLIGERMSAMLLTIPPKDSTLMSVEEGRRLILNEVDAQKDLRNHIPRLLKGYKNTKLFSIVNWIKKEKVRNASKINEWIRNMLKSKPTRSFDKTLQTLLQYAQGKESVENLRSAIESFVLSDENVRGGFNAIDVETDLHKKWTRLQNFIEYDIKEALRPVVEKFNEEIKGFSQGKKSLSTGTQKLIKSLNKNSKIPDQGIKSMLTRYDSPALFEIKDQLESIKDLDLRERISLILDNLLKDTQDASSPKIKKVDILKEVWGEVIEQVDQETSDYEKDFSGEGRLNFGIVKGLPYRVWAYNCGVCVGNSDDLWDDPSFMLLAVFNENNQAVGFVHLSHKVIDGKKILFVPGINPTSDLLSESDPEDLTKKIMDVVSDIAIQGKYDELHLPTSEMINSNKHAVRKAIKNLFGKNIIKQWTNPVSWIGELPEYAINETYQIDLKDFAKKSKVRKSSSSNIKKASSFIKGGIDFNEKNINITTSGGEIEFTIPLDLQNISSSSIQGFVPIIINVTPLTNFTGLLGLDDTDKEDNERLSYVPELVGDKQS